MQFYLKWIWNIAPLSITSYREHLRIGSIEAIAFNGFYLLLCGSIVFQDLYAEQIEEVHFLLSLCKMNIQDGHVL